jgi:hypothetical protein
MYENGPIRPVETVLKRGGGGIKGKDRGGESNQDILQTLL